MKARVEGLGADPKLALVQDGRYARELARLLREAGQVVPPGLETMTGGGAGPRAAACAADRGPEAQGPCGAGDPAACSCSP